MIRLSPTFDTHPSLHHFQAPAALVSLTLLAALHLPAAAQGATQGAAPPTAAAAQATPGTEPLMLMAGASRVVQLERPVERVSVGHPGVVDVTLTGQRELYVLGRGVGVTNIMLWSRGYPVTVMEVQVDMDVAPLRRQLAQLLPTERDIQVHAAADSVVLTGSVSSVLRAEQAMQLAQGHVRALARHAVPAATAAGGAHAHAPAPAAQVGTAAGMAAAPLRPTPAAGHMGGMSGGMSGGMGAMGGMSAHNGPHVINLMSVRQAQQVMLEVKVAEISRSLLDQFGVSLNLNRVSGSMSYGLVTQALQDVFGRLTLSGRNGSMSVDAKAQDALVRILAEPNIVALSGQEGSFLAGGKVFIPVARDSTEGRSTITLEEKEYGVGLRFTPQVLDDDVVQLRVAPEVSELSKAGSPFLSASGVTTVLPSFTTRRASTTVLLRDGQSLAIAGLIKNNITESLNKFPFLADIPVLGALFRSTEFQTDRSELLFIITPRLVKALAAGTALPTDRHQTPSRVEGLLGGRLEGRAEGEVGIDQVDAAQGEAVRGARAQQTLNPQAGGDMRLPEAVDAKAALSALHGGKPGGSAAHGAPPHMLDPAPATPQGR